MAGWIGEAPMPCGTCGADTKQFATQRCDACWAIESGLFEYLVRGGTVARSFVEWELARTRGVKR